MPPKTPERKNQLLDLALDFTVGMISGHESAMYKATIMTKTSLELKEFQTDSYDSIYMHFAAKYINDCYKSLIEGTDPHVVETFNEMINVNNHSIICILNFIWLFHGIIRKGFERQKFKIESYDKYMFVVRFQLSVLKPIVRVLMNGCLDHECSGPKLSELDPNDPFIKFGDPEETPSNATPSESKQS